MSTPGSVLVVGASAAGLGTAEPCGAGATGELTVLGAEPHLPYDRPPLSKQVLSGAWAPEQAQLRPEAELSALEAQFVVGDPAVALDAATRTVRTAAGRTLRADVVVIATGLRPRVLPGSRGWPGSTSCARWRTRWRCAPSWRPPGTWWSSATGCSARRSPPPRGPWA